MKPTEILITPEGSTEHPLQEIWAFRDLFYFLAWRDVLARYKQTVIGTSWSVLRPVLTMIIVTIVFHHIAKLPSGNVPYPVLVFAGILPWQFFSKTVAEGSNALVNNAALISKVYFPRIIIPTTAMFVGLLDFFISFVILLALMAAFGVFPDIRILTAPLLLLLTIAGALGVSFFVSALNVKYRDFRHAVPFALQLGLFISPVGYDSHLIAEKWRILFYLNPMAGIIDGFRWALLGGESTFHWHGFLLSAMVSMFLFFFGIHYFLKAERGFADVI